MTAAEMIVFFDEQAADAAYGINAAVKKRVASLAVFNVNEQFKCNLMKSLIQWRHQVESPRAALLAAVEGFESGCKAIEFPGYGAAAVGLCSEKVRIVSYLVDKSIESPPPQEIAGARKLDYLIGQWLHTGELGRDYDLHLNAEREEALAFATYSTYRELMAGVAADEETVGKACRLFDQRKGDTYFSGGDQTEGGGMDNAFTVDYRLAAICQKRALPWGAVHRWRW